MQGRLVRIAPEAILLVQARHVRGKCRKCAVDFLICLTQNKKPRSRGFTYRNIASSCIGSKRHDERASDIEIRDVETRDMDGTEHLAVLVIICYLAYLAQCLTTCLGPLAHVRGLEASIKQQKTIARKNLARKAGRLGLTGSSRHWRELELVGSSGTVSSLKQYGVGGDAISTELPGQIPTLFKPKAEAPAPEKIVDSAQQLKVIYNFTNDKPSKIGVFGTRNLTAAYGHCIKHMVMSFAAVGHKIYTSGGGDTNMAVIAACIEAGKLEQLTVILPQSLSKQPAEIRETLKLVPNLVENPKRDHLPLAEASKKCNKEIIDKVDVAVITYQSDSHVLKQAIDYATSLGKLSSPFGVDPYPKRGLFSTDEDDVP